MARAKGKQDSRQSPNLQKWSISESLVRSCSSSGFVLRTWLINQNPIREQKNGPSTFQVSLFVCEEGVLLITPYLFKETLSKTEKSLFGQDAIIFFVKFRIMKTKIVTNLSCRSGSSFNQRSCAAMLISFATVYGKEKSMIIGTEFLNKNFRIPESLPLALATDHLS